LCTEDNILLKGIYETESGNLTEVHIRLLPEENGSSEQKWTVVNIRRLVNVRMNDQDLNEAKKKLSERYKIFNTEDENGYQKTEPTDKGSFTFRGDSSGFYFDLEYSSPIYNYFHKSINPPPQCTKSINFD